MNERLRLVSPRKGLSENWSKRDQERGTTPDELNARVQDPVTGRLVDSAQRAGFRKFSTVAIGASKVADMIEVQLDQKAVTYSVVADASITALTDKPPSHGAVRDLAMDDVGNVYVLDGNLGWAKYSADLKFVQAVAAPVVNRAAVLRALEVDEFRNVYVGVGEGGLQSDAFLARWNPRLDLNGKVEYRLTWTIKPNRFIGELHYSRGLLYTVQNDVRQGRAFAVVYELLTTETPRVFREWEIPYPSRCIRAAPSGAVYTSSPPNATRGANPIAPLTSKALVGDTVQTYEDAGLISIYARYKTGRRDSLELDEELKCNRWTSIAKNGVDRSWYVPYGEIAQTKTATPPRYVAEGPLVGKPALYFNGLDNFMRTPDNPGVVAGFADQQQSALPGHLGAAFAVFVVAVPVAQAAMNCLLSQKTDNTLGQVDGAAFERGIIFNRDEADGLGAVASGLVSISDDGAPTAPAAVGAGTGGMPRSMRFDTKTHSAVAGAALQPAAVLISWVCTGRLSPGGTMESVFRVNGCPVDRWDSRPVEHAKGTYLGVSPNVNWGFMQGYVYEIIVLKRRSSGVEADLFSDEGAQAYDYPDIAFDGTSNTVLEKIEGALMREYGIGHLLDGGSVASFQLYKVGDGGADSTYIHPYGDATGALKKGLVPWSGTAGADPNQLATLDGILCKWEAQDGAFVCANALKGGIGYGLELRPDISSGQTIYSVGPKKTSAPTNDATAVQFADLGSSFFSIGVDFVMPSSRVLVDPFCRIAVDDLANLYIPVTPDSTTGAKSLFVLANGLATTLVAYQTDPTIGSAQGCFAALVPKKTPTYPPSDIATGLRRAEVVYLGRASSTLSGSPDKDGLSRERLVSVVALSAVPRVTALYAVCGADLKTFAEPATVTTVAAGVFGASASMVTSALLFGDVFFTDGNKYIVAHTRSGVAEEFKALKGKLAPRLRVFESWRGRLVGFGDPDDPFNYIMSAKDDPYDHDTGRPDRTPTQAIDGKQSDLAGRLVEPINAFIPLTNERAIIGTSSSIHLLVGDPATDGQIDVLSKEYGIAFGRAWTQDALGNVYAFLSSGGVIRISGAGIERISENRIEKRLRAINQSTHRVVMAFDHDTHTLYLYAVPFGAGFGGTIVESYAWEARLNAWHPDAFAAPTMQPTSVFVTGGRVLIGSEDGFVRVLDPAAVDDDGQPTRWSVTYGPILPEGDTEYEYRLNAFQTELASDQQGAMLEVFQNQNPEGLGVSMATARVPAGMSERVFRTVRGAYLYVRVSNPFAGQRAALHSTWCDWERAGRRVPRPTP